MNFLSSDEVETLRTRHRNERDRRVCDRIKAVLLANEGWTYLMIAQALLLDDQTISRHIQEYKEKQKLNIESGMAYALSNLFKILIELIGRAQCRNIDAIDFFPLTIPKVFKANFRSTLKFTTAFSS